MAETRLRLSSLGGREARAEYREHLKTTCARTRASSPPEVRERIDLNPLRAFDSEHPGTRAVMASAPRLLEYLSPEDSGPLRGGSRPARRGGRGYEIDPTLVRGLDYYTRTVFELTSERSAHRAGWAAAGATTAS